MILTSKTDWSSEKLRQKMVKKMPDCQIQSISQNVMVKKSAAMVHLRVKGKNLNVYGSLNSTHLLTYIGLMVGPIMFITLRNNQAFYISILVSILITFIYFFGLWATQRTKAKEMEARVLDILQKNK